MKIPAKNVWRAWTRTNNPTCIFVLGVANNSVVSTKLGGDEVAGTAGDARGDERTEKTTGGNAGIDVNMVEDATDVSDVEVVTDVNKVAVVADVGKVDEVTDVDPETRGPTRRVPADTCG